MIEYTIDKNNPDPIIIKKTAEAIKDGKIVIFPCDTSYGIATDATNFWAVDKIYKIKHDEAKKPISVIVKDLEMAKNYAIFDERTENIFKNNLPGLITLILPFKSPKILPAPNPSFRIPNIPFTNLLSDYLDIPYTATSANTTGYPPAHHPQEIYKYFGRSKPQPDFFINAGDLEETQSSTVADLTFDPPKIIRQGPAELHF